MDVRSSTAEIEKMRRYLELPVHGGKENSSPPSLPPKKQLSIANFAQSVPRLVSSPDPAPKEGRRVWGLASVCWVWPALGARADIASAQTNLESDWLVGSTVTFLRAVSHMTVPKL